MSFGSFRWMILTAVISMLPCAVHADFTVDNFTTASPTITQTGVGTTTSVGVIGDGILGTRTLSLTVASPLTAASANVGDSPGLAESAFNGNYNPVNPTDNFTLTETFAAENVTGLYLNFLLGSSTGVTLTITANGSSTYTLTDPTSTAGTEHSIALSSFSNSSVFGNLTSLSFVETFPNPSISGPTAAFSGPIFLSPSVVPEPSSLILYATAVGTLVLGRRYLTRRGQTA